MKKPTLKVMNDYCKTHEVEPVVLLLADDCELRVTPSLSLMERLTFVNRVTDFCVSEIGEKHPEYFELIFWTTVFQMMSNLPIPKTKGEESVDLTTMLKWIEVMPRTFFDKLYVANNEYVWCLKEDCLSKVSARAEYLTSFVGAMSSFNNQAGDLLGRIQDIEEVNGELIAQADAAKKIVNIYQENVIELPQGEADE